MLGFEDETWWSRFASPNLHAWSAQRSCLQLVQQTPTTADPDPKALACYGLLVRNVENQPEQVWLRFVDGRPVSGVTTAFLEWCCERLERAGKKALLMVWDNASWHLSAHVRRWMREHNRRVKQQGRGVRIVPCPLPKKSPWLNRIEPHWVHAKRQVVEAGRLLNAQELTDRICAYFGCAHEPHLAIAEYVT